MIWNANFVGPNAFSFYILWKTNFVGRITIEVVLYLNYPSLWNSINVEVILFELSKFVEDVFQGFKVFYNMESKIWKANFVCFI